MAYRQEWTETVTPAGGVPSVMHHAIDVSDEQESAEIARKVAEAQAIKFAPAGVRELLPGDAGTLMMPDESVLSIGWQGNIYSDGRQLGAARGSKLVLVGKTIYARGATDNKWWRWSGTGWYEVTEVDERLLAP